MANLVRLTGFIAVELAERNSLRLSKVADRAEGAMDHLTPGDARAIAAEDPSLVFVDLAVQGGRIDVGAGRVWLDHARLGWIEMPARYDAERIGEEDIVYDSQLRRLSDREARGIEGA